MDVPAESRFHPSSNDSDEPKLRSLVAENPADFSAWTSLITEFERISPNDVEKISWVYDSFLSEFPLCYGYWKKYAEHMARLRSTEEAVEVYERAIQSAAYSVGLWASYCRFGMMSFEDPAHVRRLFEKGLSFVGKDYLCHLLWDKYLEFEYSQKQWSHVAHIYVRTLRFPIKKLDDYYESFKKLVAIWEDEIGCQDCCATELQSEVPSNDDTVHNRDIEEVKTLKEQEISSVIKDLMDPPVGSPWKNTLKKYLSAGDHLYKKASQENSKIKLFEARVKRPYFHVKLLDSSQLENWHHYLDFVEAQEDFDWTVKLYERCLIPCANYPEFWIRYVELMEAHGGREIANLELARATRIFLKGVPGIHLFCARFKEQIGDIFGARAALLQCSSDLAPVFIENVRRRANLEKRLGNLEAASLIYKEAVKVAKKKHDSQTVSVLYLHSAEFIYMVTGNADAARNILIKGIQHLPQCKVLLEELIRFETMHGGPRKIDVVDSIVAQATASGLDISEGLTAEEREHISGLFLELVDLCGTTHEIKKAWERHRKLFPYVMRPLASDKNSAFWNSVVDKVGSRGSITLPNPANGNYSTCSPNQQSTTEIKSRQALTCRIESEKQNVSGDDFVNVSREDTKAPQVSRDYSETMNQDQRQHASEPLHNLTPPSMETLSINSLDIEVHHSLPTTPNESKYPQKASSLSTHRPQSSIANSNLKCMHSKVSAEPLHNLTPPSMETLSINSLDIEVHHSVPTKPNESKYAQKASSLSTNRPQSSSANSNLKCMHSKVSAEVHFQPNHNLSHMSTSQRISQSRAKSGKPSHQQQVRKTNSALPHHPANRGSRHQMNYPAQVPGNQVFPGYAQHPQQQWQVSPYPQYPQAAMQSQVSIDQGYQQPQAWQSQHAQLANPSQNQYQMSSSQVYPTAAYVWPMPQHTFAAAPQSQPSAQPIAQIQTQVYQYPVQNNEPYGQTQSNYGYDPQLWEYHQQQQLQQQQQQQQLQDLPQVQQQQPPITASLDQLHQQQQPQQQQQQLNISPSQAQMWTNYYPRQALPPQYCANTQSSQQVGESQIEVTTLNNNQAPGPDYPHQPQQAPGADYSHQPQYAPGPDYPHQPQHAPGPDYPHPPHHTSGPDYPHPPHHAPEPEYYPHPPQHAPEPDYPQPPQHAPEPDYPCPPQRAAEPDYPHQPEAPEPEYPPEPQHAPEPDYPHQPQHAPEPGYPHQPQHAPSSQ